MNDLSDSVLIDAILDLRELDAVMIAERILGTGVTMGIVEGICSTAIQAIGRDFMPCPECIDDLVAANEIVDRVVNLGIPGGLETQPAVDKRRSGSSHSAVAVFVAAPLSSQPHMGNSRPGCPG